MTDYHDADIPESHKSAADAFFETLKRYPEAEEGLVFYLGCVSHLQEVTQ